MDSRDAGSRATDPRNWQAGLAAGGGLLPW